MMRTMRQYTILAATAAVAAACGDSSGPGSGGSRQITLSFAAGSPSTVAGVSAARSGFNAWVYTAAPGTTISISRAQVVLSDIELKQVGMTGCSDDDASDDHGSDVSAALADDHGQNSGHDGGDDSDDVMDDAEDGHCGPTVRSGPMLVDLPVNGGVATPITVSVPAGRYRALKYRIAPVGNDAAAQAFLAAHPEFAHTSIRVEGTVNGEPFVYTSNVHTRVSLAFPSPVSVDQSGFNLTIAADLSGWFKSRTGAFVDPRTAATIGSNREAIERSIRDSFRAFRDHDRDGHEDANDDHGHDA